MKNLFYILFIVFFISSCSKDDDILEPKEEEKEEPSIDQVKFDALKNNGNIFEAVIFKLHSENTFKLMTDYDSITWKVSDMEGRLKILNYNNNSSSFVFQWSHNFFYPGVYQTFLFGYKDDKIISADTVLIRISNDKDFLGYNWSDIKESLGHGIGYQDVISDNYSFVTYQYFDEGIPSIEFYAHQNYSANKEDELVFVQKSEKILFDYIKTLYSSPNYDSRNENELVENYNKLFKRKKGNSYHPKAIWITPKSKIVLLKYENESFPEFRVSAEPNN